MRTENIGDWLSRLASSASAPGGGAVAAMHAAMAAGLVEMVCNLTIGKPRYAEHEPVLAEVRAEAGRLRDQAVELADADADAFTAVTDAYRLPKDTDEARRARTEAIQAALVAAAEVPVRTAEVAARVVALAARIADRSNPNVLSDVAVAASSGAAALESAVVNVAVNRAGITAAEVRDQLATAIADITGQIDNARRVTADVRERISG